MSQYRGPAARAMGDRLRAQRRKAREAARARAAAAWRASPAGRAELARRARRLEHFKTCQICGAPTPPESAAMLHCCGVACYEIQAAKLGRAGPESREGDAR